MNREFGNAVHYYVLHGCHYQALLESPSPRQQVTPSKRFASIEEFEQWLRNVVNGPARGSRKVAVGHQISAAAAGAAAAAATDGDSEKTCGLFAACSIA